MKIISVVIDLIFGQDRNGSVFCYFIEIRVRNFLNLFIKFCNISWSCLGGQLDRWTGYMDFANTFHFLTSEINLCQYSMDNDIAHLEISELVALEKQMTTSERN